MARPFKRTTYRRIVDKIMRWFIQRGIGLKHYYILTVKGRKSGKSYSLPVALIEEENQRWLVALTAMSVG